MRSKKIQTKLTLKKQTIAGLNDAEMMKERGGETGVTCRLACTGVTYCPTGCWTQCVICY